MSQNKTGGGPGTNQYKIKGTSKSRQKNALAGAEPGELDSINHRPSLSTITDRIDRLNANPDRDDETLDSERQAILEVVLECHQAEAEITRTPDQVFDCLMNEGVRRSSLECV